MKQKSAGCVIYREENGKRYYLLLEARSISSNKTLWGFPKGHIEKGEIPIQTALRETREESGVVPEVHPGFRKTIKYFFKAKSLINKEVIYFLGKAAKKDVKISHEHINYRWLEFQEAKKLLKFRNSRSVLEDAEKFLSGSRIKAIIFDWNGVITDSLRLDHEIFLKEGVRRKVDVPKSMSFYSNMFDDNVFKCLEKVGFDMSDPEGEKVYQQLYLAGISKTKPFDGIRDLLAELKKKYKLAIITSNYSPVVHAFFKMYKMENIFDVILGCDTARRKEEKIRILLDKFSLKKSEVIYIGDTVSDIKACKAAGIRIIAASWGYQNRARLAQFDPDFIANKPGDIAKIMEKESSWTKK